MSETLLEGSVAAPKWRSPILTCIVWDGGMDG